LKHEDLQLNKIYKVTRSKYNQFDYIILLYKNEDVNSKNHFIKHGISFNFHSGLERMINTVSIYESFNILVNDEIIDNKTFINIYKYEIVKNILSMDWQKLISPYGESYPEYLNNLLQMMCDAIR
jgi:hypothetical protein